MKFIRTDYHKYSKLGRRRKKKQKYRRARGIDNKIRLKEKGRLRNVEIGFRSEKKSRGLLKGLNPIMIYNLEDLKKLNKNEIGIVAKIGDKKKALIAEYALNKNIPLSNLKPKKFLEKIKIKLESKEKEKQIKLKKKEIKEKEKKKQEIKKEEEKKKSEKEENEKEKLSEDKNESK